MNMFEKAKQSDKPAKAEKTKKSKKREVKIDGLELFASVKAVQKALDGLVEGVETDIKRDVAAEFVYEGLRDGKRPENFRGHEGIGEASCELRKRSSASKLTSEERAKLDAAGISYETVVSAEETFKINPAYFSDQALLGKVAKALEKVPGLPEDFIVHEQGATHYAVAEESLDQVFQVQNAKIATDLLSIVGTLALKPKLATGDVQAAMKLLQDALSGDDE